MTTRTPAPVPVDTGAAAPVALDRAAAPVPVPVDTTPALRPPPERAPAPVNTLVDPELPAPPVPVVRPSATQAAPAPDPYPEEPVAAVIPVEEQPVPEIPVPESDPNITPDTSRYITVSEDGAVVLINASTLNFTGTGVSVTANNSTATIDITAGGSGYGNANVTTLLAAFGSNSIVTTGNITGGNFSITGNSVTWSHASITQTSAADIAITGDGQVTVRSLDGTYQWTFGSNGHFTAPGNVTANYFLGNTQGLTGNITNLDSLNFTVENISALVGNNGVNIGAGGNNNLVVLPTEVLIQNVPLNTTGNISANYFIGDGSQLTNLPGGGGLPIANGTSNFDIATANGNVTITAGGSTSTFADNGTLYPADDVRVGATGGRFVQDCADGTTSIRWYNIGVEEESQLVRAYTGDPDGATPETERGRISVDWISNTQSGITIVAVSDDGNISQEYAWKFQGDSTAEFPGNIRMGASAASQIHTAPNSSGDGNGYTTIHLVPDETVFGNDQYLIIDPTGGSPGHIHIRAGGIQDYSAADLFLGGENSYVKLPAGSNPNVEISANTLVWTFNGSGLNGELTLPTGEGIIRSIDDTISLVSYNTTSGNANSVYLGSSGGLGFYDQEIGGNWLQIFRSGVEPEITVPLGSGNANLLINNSSSGNVKIWNFGADGDLSAAGNITTTGNVSAGNISTTGSGGDITLTSGNIVGALRMVTTPTALANLTAVAGGRAFINDANLVASGNFGTLVGTGGSNTVPVWSDGTNWYIG